MDHWKPDATTLSIREYGTVTAAAAVVDQVSPDSWDTLRLSATRFAGEQDWTVSAEQYVGVARLRVGAREIPLQVTPKLPVDIFFMADYAFGARERNMIVDRRLHADLATIRTDPAACLIAWLIADIEAFARRHLRRDYKLRREILEGGPRGRLLLEDYVASHLALGLPQEVPCEYPDLTFDTAPNRAIRATLRYALAQCSLLRLPQARAALRRRTLRTLARFAGVSDVRLTTAMFAHVRRLSPPRHYQAILDRCDAFASGLYMEREIGQHTRQAFLWDMNLLFQEALRSLLMLWPGGHIDLSPPARAAICAADGSRLSHSKVDPDYVLHTPSGGVLLLDAKYKDTQISQPDATAVAVPGAGKIRVTRADVYQVVAYRQHDRYPGASAGLVFPVALPAGKPLPDPHTVRGFGDPIHLLFLDVGASAARNLAGFYDRLTALADSLPVAAAA